MNKRMAIFLTLAFLATSANADYYLINGGTSSNGTWNQTGSNGDRWLQGEESEMGEAATSTHTVSGGTFSTGTLGVGRYARNTSSITVTDDATVSIGDMLWVGRQGKGTLLIEDSSVVNVNNGVFVGYSTGGEGTITITGTGSQLNVTGNNSLWLGGYWYSANAGKSATVNVETGGTLSVTGTESTGIHVGDDGAGNLNVTGGTVKTSALFVGYYNSANTAGKGTFTLTSGTVSLTDHLRIGNAAVEFDGGTFTTTNNIATYGGVTNFDGTAVTLNALLVGGHTASATSPAVVNFNGGSIKSSSSATTQVRDYGTLNINAANSGNAFNSISLAANGCLNVNAGVAISLTGQGGELSINDANAQVAGPRNSLVIVNLAGNIGKLYFNGRTAEGTQGEFAFTNTNTTYTGYIDGYSWPLATANIGTAAEPLKLAPSGVSTAPDAGAEYRLQRLDIGTEGNTGYVVLSSGIIRTSQTENRGIYLGDTHQDSDGTLVLTGGSLAGHHSTGNAGNLFVGAASGGKGRLILAGGTLASKSGGSGKINVTVNPTGTVEIAAGSYTWAGLQLTPGTTFAGNLEITGGTLDTQGNGVTVSTLNSGSQYNTTKATGTLNNSGTQATVTLNNTATGAYDGYAVTGRLNVQFGTAGQSGTVESKNGTISSTGEITILSDTTFENMTTFGNDLTIDADAALAILFDPSSYDPNASVLMDFGDIDGTLQVSFTEPWTQAYGWDFDLFTANNLPEMILPYGFHGSIIDGMVTITGDPAALPEPSTWCLMILGFLGMVWMRRKK